MASAAAGASDTRPKSAGIISSLTGGARAVSGQLQGQVAPQVQMAAQAGGMSTFFLN